MGAFALLAAAALAMAPSASQCPGRPQTSAGVLATETDWVHAIDARDVPALACLLAPEFSDSNWRGQVIPRADVLVRLPSRPNATLKLSDLSVFLDGPFAVVRGVNTQVAANGSDGGSVRFTDVFVYRGGGWRAVSAQETLIAKE
jgi:hypothetical protein